MQVEIQSKETNDLIIIEEPASLTNPKQTKPLLNNNQNDFDIFSEFQWKQSKDGKIHFLQLTSSQDTQDETDFQEPNTETTNINTSLSEFHLKSSSSAFNSKAFNSPSKKASAAAKPQKLGRAERILDNTDKMQLEKYVITEWGLGKIVKKENQIVTVDVYGNPAEFPESAIKLNYSVTVLVLIGESSLLLDLKVDSSTSISKFKKKIAEIVNSHSSLIVLVHSGRKVEHEKSILELGIYDKDSFMAVVKDAAETAVSRGGNLFLNSKFSNTSNALRFKCDEDIVLTGLGLYRNDASDVYYDLLVYEEKDNLPPHLIFNEKKVLVLRKNKEGDEIFKYAISHLSIKKNRVYQVHQNILNADLNSQFSGIGFAKEVESLKTRAKFSFFDCSLTSKINGTNVERGLVPALYYMIKTEEEN